MDELVGEMLGGHNYGVGGIGLIDHQAPHPAGHCRAHVGGRRICWGVVVREQYIDWVGDIGNMVSASVGYVLVKILEQERLRHGDTVLLFGTAAGLTANALVLRL